MHVGNHDMFLQLPLFPGNGVYVASIIPYGKFTYWNIVNMNDPKSLKAFIMITIISSYHTANRAFYMIDILFKYEYEP